MRHFWIVLIIHSLATSSVSAAEVALDPAAYLAILVESEIIYSIMDEPSLHSVLPGECPRRDQTTRVITVDGKRRLVPWEVETEARSLLHEAETHYEQKRYDEAIERYVAAIEIDPDAVNGYLYSGDALLFGKGDPAAALSQYMKAIELDPTLPMGHLFAATAYVRLGKPDAAREEIIQALTYYPAYDAVWSVALRRPEIWNARAVVTPKFEPPAGYLGMGDDGVEIYAGPDGEYLGYAICKAAWQNEPQFRSSRAPEGGWSLEEERACVLNQLMATMNATEARIFEDKKTRRQRDPVVTDAEIIAGLPPLERHLLNVAKSGMLDGYVLFEIIGRHCPLALSTFPTDAIESIEDYIRGFVIVADQ